eukprot:IDg16972t1
MGARLTALCVTSVRARADCALSTRVHATPHTASMTDVARTVRAHCPNLHSLDFAPSRCPHWSERAYVEALRFVPDPPAPVLVKVRRKRPRRLARFLKGLWMPRLPRGFVS